MKKTTTLTEGMEMAILSGVSDMAYLKATITIHENGFDLMYIEKGKIKTIVIVHAPKND